MGLLDRILGREEINEAIKAFDRKGDVLSKREAEIRDGEGVDDVLAMQTVGFGAVGLNSFNTFYNNSLNMQFKNELDRIMMYREMAECSEIADVIEDAVNESINADDEGRTLHLNILDKTLKENENIANTLRKEFYNFFYNKLNINTKLEDMYRTYMIDGRMFYERIIDEKHKSQGIQNIKKLPTETMDFQYDPRTGEMMAYFQYLAGRPVRPKTVEEAEKAKDVVIFYPEQIGMINYNVFGRTKYEMLGYLEKAKIPYNQLKLLETSVIIYRIIRAPERLVFKIDTGNMPRDKAMKFVEKIKEKMTKKQTYDSKTGALSQDPEIVSMLENYYLPQSADGRGSQIETVGGNSAGFSELDDIYYFARKMFRALKYPLSRINAEQEKGEGNILFGGNSTAEISRDEVKWAKFLERQQKRFCDEFRDLFLLHLEFKGLKKQYNLLKKSFNIFMEPPSNYKEQMAQNLQETRFNNYTVLADRPEFSQYWLMQKYLHMDAEDIQENIEGLKKDKELGLKSEEDAY